MTPWSAARLVVFESEKSNPMHIARLLISTNTESTATSSTTHYRSDAWHNLHVLYLLLHAILQRQTIMIYMVVELR